MRILKWYKFLIICIVNSFLYYIMHPINIIDIIFCIIIDYIIIDIINDCKDYKNDK